MKQLYDNLNTYINGSPSATLLDELKSILAGNKEI